MTSLRKKRSPRAPATKPRDRDVPHTRARHPLAIVGLGASAGGLEALRQFFTHVEEADDCAFVVVQHLDPTRQGSLVELLQGYTPLPVVEVVDGARIEGGKVYVIPRATDLSLIGGALRLEAPAAARGHRFPIDHLFRSLAAELGPESAAVILSGMGSDGTGGARAVREAAGVVFVQAPETAKFDAMPRSVIDAGLADVVAAADALPRRIREVLAQPAANERTHDAAAGAEDEALDVVVAVLRGATGHDFSLYKRSTLARRVARRAGVHQLAVPAYVQYLRENPAEGELLFKELLIGVTSFFRDADAWEKLAANALPTLLDRSPEDGVFRAWVPGCSTGEEAYTLCILVREALTRRGLANEVRVQIFATDLDASAIERARRGLYPLSISRDVSAERLGRYFIEDESGYRVRKEIRDAVVFAVHNAVQDPPFTKLDLVSCRNLLIYLTPELQQKLIPRFHYALNRGGVLFLGGSETIGGFGDLFTTMISGARLYRKLETVDRPSLSVDLSRVALRPGAASAAPDAATGAVRTMQSAVEQLLLRRFAPPAVLVSPKGDVVYINGKLDPYLELPAGKANWNVFAMARDGLRRVLVPALAKATTSKKVVRLPQAKVERNGGVQSIEVTVEPIVEASALRGFLVITFVDAGTKGRPGAAKAKPSRAGGRATASLELQLQQARDDLQATRREMQISEEELKATNEELQATNEELQSTNEELTTSKEEMQSMNEELQTLNAELHAKLDELSRAGNDMKNLLDSTEIAILFLDDALRVRRFTPSATELFKLIPGDVGRPLADLASNLDYDALYDDAREVLQRLASKERRTSTRDGRTYRARIMPYRTSDNRIDGVVITFTSVNGERNAQGPR